MQVEEDDGDGLALEERAGVAERARLDHPVAVQLEIHPAQEPDRRLVVHDEHDRPVYPRCHESESTGRTSHRSPSVSFS